jgi:TolB-like protein
MDQLFKELSKRNVFRVGIAYCVVGWLIAQVADLAADNFGAPEWVMRMLLIFLLLGLPVALFLAWAFELTPQGVVRAEDVPDGAPKDPRSGKLLNRVIIATLLLIIGGLVWDRFREPAPAANETVVEIDRSIAVLPFADFSPDGDQGWFADGLTDEILNALARTDDLRVASRTSAFSYRDTLLEIPQIAAELGVAHILEGSVRRNSDRVRITAQLIRAVDDTHLWSETFDGNADDAIEIQERIALSIAQALQTAMDPDELERMLAAGTRSVEAWELYLRAQQRWREISSGSVDDTGDKALAMLEQAVALDPSFVDANIAIAKLFFSHISRTSMLQLSSVADQSEARARFDAAISTAASGARSETASLQYRALQAQADARFDELLRLARLLVVMHPNNADARISLMAAQLYAGDYAGVKETGLEAARLFRDEGRPLSTVYQYVHRVDRDAALAMAEWDIAEQPRARLDMYQLQRVFLYAGKLEEAAEFAADYLRSPQQGDSLAMVRIRQACAEGRVADADAVFEAARDLIAGNPNEWLFLKTLGHDEAARQALLPLDNPDDYYALAAFLAYTTFDPADYPYLNSRLKEQGISRPPAHDIPFACTR